jgi:hypothetical protein
LQTVESLHEVPFGTGAYWQPNTGSHVSVVQMLPSLQTSGVPAVQVPLWQVSAPLQGLPSEQDEPFATTVFWQLPPLQTSDVHGLPSLQSVATTQDWHPGIGAWLQPEIALHVSVVQALLSLQSSGVPAVHVPLWQVSAPLQTVESAQDEPFATWTC